MEKVKFGEFRLDKIVNFESYPQVPAGFISKDGDIPFLTQVSRDNGINKFIAPHESLILNKGGVLVTGVDNIANGVMYYHDKDFYANKMIGLRSEFMTENAALYLATKLKKFYQGYDYNAKISLGILERSVIGLPMIDEETPDWEYMDNYIKDVKARRLKIIEDFVDKELTEIIEMKVLEDVEFGEFRLGDYFEAILGKSLNLTGEGVRVVSGLTENNGTSGFTTTPNEIFKNEITISNRGEYSGTTFFQEGEFTLFNNVICLKSLVPISNNAKTYVATVVNKLPYGGYDHYPTKSSIVDDVLLLPMIDPETPDWDFMDNYMKRIESEKKDLIRQFVENARGGGV